MERRCRRQRRTQDRQLDLLDADRPSVGCVRPPNGTMGHTLPQRTRWALTELMTRLLIEHTGGQICAIGGAAPMITEKIGPQHREREGRALYLPCPSRCRPDVKRREHAAMRRLISISGRGTSNAARSRSHFSCRRRIARSLLTRAAIWANT